MSTDTLSTLLRGLAEALTPYLTTGADVDVDDAVDRAVSNYDFDDIVNDKIDDYDFSSVVGDAVGDIYWPDYDVLTSGDFDASTYDLVTTDEVRDIVTEELRETGAVVTVDNILSTLATALTAAAETRAA